MAEQLDFDDALGDFGGDASPSIEPPPKRRRGLLIALILIVILIIIGVMVMLRLRGPEDATAQDSKTKGNPTRVISNKKVKYEKLYGQLDAEQLAKVLKELSFKQIPFNIEQRSKRDFDVYVDKDRLEEAKVLLALKGLPGGLTKGYEIFDESQNLGATEFDKRIRYIRALSGELEKAINEFDTVDSAMVQIVLPEPKLFSTIQPPVTASVLIRRAPGADINKEVVLSIIQYVSNAVENLQPENITVIDTEGQILSADALNDVMVTKKTVQAVAPAVKAETAAVEGTDTKAQTAPMAPDAKSEMEAAIEIKVNDQLKSILPSESYKVKVVTEMGVDPNQAPVISQMAISVLIDERRDDINLNPITKKKIFNAIASASGYVKGRDIIQLSKADFSALGLQDAGEADQQAAVSTSKTGETAKKAGKSVQQLLDGINWKYGMYGAGGLAGVGIIIALVIWVRNRRSQNKEEWIFQRREEAAAPIPEVPPVYEPILLQLQQLSAKDPYKVASVITEWVKGT